MYELFAAEKDKLNTPPKPPPSNRSILCTSISIDFGIMEKAENVYVIPASFPGATSAPGTARLGKHAEGLFLQCRSRQPGDDRGCQELHGACAGQQTGAAAGTGRLHRGRHQRRADDLPQGKEQEIKEYVAEIKRNKGDKYL